MRRDPNRIQRFVDEIAQRLDLMEASPSSGRIATRANLDVILRKCGYEHRSAKALEKIEARFNEVGIYPHPSLVEEGLDRKHKIYFGRQQPDAPRPRGLMFAVENDLERFIKANFEFLEPFRSLRLVKSQFEVPGLRRVDLLARDTRTRDYVLIELKKDDPDDRIVAQVSIYLDAIVELAREEGVGVRVIIITGQPNAVLHEHLARIVEGRATIEWYLYEVTLSLTGVSYA